MMTRLCGYTALVVLMACSSSSNEPSDPLPPPEEGISHLAIAGGRTCALDTGRLYCWGPRHGDDEGFATVPVREDQAELFVELAGQRQWHCAVGVSSSLHCVGGILRDKNLVEPAPGEMADTRGLRAVSVTMSHACGLTPAGRIECFGSMVGGVLGRSWDPAGPDSVRHDWRNRPIPSTITFRALAGGYQHSCGISADRRAYCWGDSAQVGNPTVPFLRTVNPCGATSSPCTTDPAAVVNLTGVTAIAAGQSHTCAIAETGLHCWGANFAGQLGTPGAPTSATPVAVPLPSAPVLLASGQSKSCAVTQDGKVYCWGQWGGNQATTPDLVPGDYPRFTSIAVGEAQACGLAAGEAWCWGIAGAYLGNGTSQGSSTPVRITIPDHDPS